MRERARSLQRCDNGAVAIAVAFLRRGCLEDVLFSIRGDMGLVASIGNILPHFAASIERRVSGTFQVYSRLLPRCVHVHDWHHLWAEVIKCGFEADECWPSTFKKLREFGTFCRWGDYRDVCSSYLALNGKSTEVPKAFTASLALWRLETLCVVFVQLGKLRAFTQTDFLSGDVCHGEG